MCLAPKKIRNPKIEAGTFLQGVDKEYLTVKCNHCEQCAFERTQNLTFRAYHEYLYTLAVSGFTLFETFTYSELNVPNSGGFTFFRPADLTKFVKRLRKRLSYDGFDVDGKLKYVFTLEYGSKYRRCHYHALFFVQFNITPEKFQEYVTACWTSLGDRYSDTTPIGRTDTKDVKQRIVNSIYGISYVCKYITKGTSVVKALKYKGWSDISHFAHDYCFSTFDSRTGESRLKWNDLKDWQLVEIWDAYVDQHPECKELVLLPRYYTSHGLGMSFINRPDFKYEDLFDVQKVPSKSKANPWIKFNVPMYYIRKVFYRYDADSKRFILNNEGRYYKEHVNSQILDSYEDMMRFNDSLYESIFSRMKYQDDKLKQYATLRDYVSSLLNGRSYKSFCYYCTFLQGRRISPIHESMIPWHDTNLLLDYIQEFCGYVQDDTLDMTIADNVYTFEIPRYSDPEGRHFDPGELMDGVPSKDRVGLLVPYSALPCFNMFDELSETLSEVKRHFNMAKCRKIKEDLELLDNQRLAKSVLQEYSCIYF